MDVRSETNSYASLELIAQVTSFAESALTVDGRPTSGTARVGISSARRFVLLRICHDDQPTFQTVTHDHGAMQALERLRVWTASNGSTLLLQRGLNDELVLRLVETDPAAATWTDSQRTASPVNPRQTRCATRETRRD
jgi:hypothetical protein